MSVHFHPLKVKEVRPETPECVSIAFDIPAYLNDTFKYKHGQYLTIRAFINREEIRRSYSICSSPLNDELRIAVKKVEGGVFSAFALEQLKKGDTIEAMPPLGKFFTELNAANRKNYIAFVAGSGITPVISILKTTLAAEPLSRFTLIYGNRNRHNIIFREELEALKNNYIDRFQLIYLLSREKTDALINYGRIDDEKCKILFGKIIDAKSIDEFFLCGPIEMIFLVKDFLEKKGVDQKKIHMELFTTPELQKPSLIENIPIHVDEVKSKITIKVDGITFDIELAYNGDSILDAALNHGADLPFACKGGVCTTCRAKLVVGKVEMDANYSLEQDELKQGFILTCQSHPRTPELIVDFDIK